MVQQEIGNRLKELRKTKGLSQTELASRSGVSAGLLSQIERGMVAPSVVNLYHIANALNTDISYFFAESQPTYKVQSAGRHPVITTNNGLDEHEILNGNWPNRPFDFIKLTLKGGEEYNLETFSHRGEEFVYVISGSLSIIYNGEHIVLESGDSISFSSSNPHLYFNEKEEDCVSIWAITPRFF